MGKPLGTLIVVVLKARNLPNKQRIGKQDPYATCTYLSHRKRTKTDKRGGQHPVWDDELRFEVYENLKDVMPSTSVATTSTGGVAPVKSSDSSLGMGGNPGVKELRVAVYADDPRDPELIGEGKVELSETLKKGEFDDWVTITNKGKYQGEIYLEMTFYSAKPPPDQLQSSSTPVRAGVFEAGSPASSVKPTQPGRNHPATPTGVHSVSSASHTPTRVDPLAVPPALRAGRPNSVGSSGTNLPLPGERGPMNSLSPRHRSTEALVSPQAAIPLPHPTRSPSRNHSYDEAAGLMNSLSISDQSSSSAYDVHATPSRLATPANVNPQHAVNDHLGRPHRHSFSTYSTYSTPSAYANIPTNADNLHRPNITRFPNPHDHANSDPYISGHQVPPHNPTINATRRPLPIPGGDTASRPASVWADYGNQGTPHQHTAIMPSQHSGPSHVHSHYAPQSSEDTFSDSSYPPSHSEQVGLASHTMHEEPVEPHMPSGPTYPSQQPYADHSPRPFHAPTPLGNMHSNSGYQPTPLRYSLPPPPPGQVPVPIHEVYRAVTPRPLPPTASHPQGAYHNQPPVYPTPNHSNQVQTINPHGPPSNNDAAYSHENYAGEAAESHHRYSTWPEPHLHQQQQYAPPLPGAPPPPPPHLQQQLQFPGYQSQPGVPLPVPPPLQQQHHHHQHLPTPSPTPGPHQPPPFHDPHDPYRVMTPAPSFSQHHSHLPPPPPHQNPALIYSPPRHMPPLHSEYPPAHYQQT